MENYPIFLNLKNQPCLVVGGGIVAFRKIERQLKAGALITVVAPTLCNEVKGLIGKQLKHVKREFLDEDIGNYKIITAATNNAEVNKRVSELADKKNIPVNVVDQPTLCTFITPSMIDRAPVTIAVSTGGNAPILARLLRAKLESVIPSNFGALAQKMGDLRSKVKSKYSKETDRRAFWESLVDGPLAEDILTGKNIELEKLFADSPDTLQQRGEVALVGAGPGNADLLTFKALRLMQRADVILYDRLVSDDILELCRHDAKKIYVGKKRNDHSLEQSKINQLLVDLAHDGNKVVRLKGGDPFIFGRGGEEIELLNQNKIPFQIVPGITAAAGCASYAGIPLTHRDFSQSCLFVTGHLRDGTVDLNWQQLSLPGQTVVIYMGLIGLPFICEKLIEHGVSPKMPIALISKGTTVEQRVFTSTLREITALIKGKDIHAPTLLIIGEVVSLREELRWEN